MNTSPNSGQMAMYTTIFPIISTRDAGPMPRFYRDLLGARVAYEFHDESGRIAYVGLRLGEAELGISVDPDDESGPGGRFSLGVYADDCDESILSLRGAGVTIVDEPADQAWGERMATVTDPDGTIVQIRPGACHLTNPVQLEHQPAAAMIAEQMAVASATGAHPRSIGERELRLTTAPSAK